MSEKHISTTALARTLQKDSKELFVLLAQGGWILKVDNHWQLTEKGKFEGGIYLQHPKYGEYIAWPESVQEHPLLRLLPDAPLTASHLGNKCHLPARLVNLLLAERGWIKKYIRGWELTPRGKFIGGEQHTSEQSGIPFVTWPENILDNPAFLSSVAQITGSAFEKTQKTLSGYRVASAPEMVVANWLFLTGVSYAYDYDLSVGAEQIRVDFFLPEFQICIDLWGDHDDAARLSQQLTKQDFYKKTHYDFIELHHTSVTELDERLAKELLLLGLAIY